MQQRRECLKINNFAEKYWMNKLEWINVRGSPEEIMNSKNLNPGNFKSHEQEFCMNFMFHSYWLNNSQNVPLAAYVQIIGEKFNITVTDDVVQMKKLAGNLRFEILAEKLKIPVIDLNKPLFFSSVSISKPWGQEIWLTGIEERGVAGITDGKYDSPIPWILALAPKALTDHKEKELILLKILDPVPEEVYGDLYFEMHKKKQEVYIVTNIDKSAWPDGTGKIRIGFKSQLIKKYGSDEAFRSAYLEAVSQYESIRKRIDLIFDQYRVEEVKEIKKFTHIENLKRWESKLPRKLRMEEIIARRKMDNFTDMMELKSGDVIKIPTYTPHALQYGVRTIEFQTPVYERKIISFAQKVMTQNHWDYREAIQDMNLKIPKQGKMKTLELTHEVLIEEIVQFSDFTVQRLTFFPSQSFRLNRFETYVLLISVFGGVRLGEHKMEAEQACLISNHLVTQTLTNDSNSNNICLLALPK